MRNEHNQIKIRSIKENALLNIAYTLANILFPVITFTYVLRILTVETMGRIAFYTSVTNYAVMLAAIGLATYGIRTVARVRDQREQLEQVVAELLCINCISTFFIIVFYFFLVFFVPQFGRDIVLALLNSIIIITTPFEMGWLFSGLEQYAYITKRTILFRAVSLCLILLLVSNTDDYYIYAGILVLSSVGTSLCNFFYARKLVNFHLNSSPNFIKHLKPMLIMFSSALAVSVYFNLDTIMLGLIKGDWEVGIYTTAVRVKIVLLQFINAISIVLLPRLSFYLSKGKDEQYRSTVQKAMAIVFIISIPMAVFFIIESMPCVLILGGNEYAASSNTMKILMPILVISGFSNVLGNQILIPNGNESCFLKAVVAGAIVNIILNCLLMPKFGSVGAATATLLAELTQMSIQTYFSKRVLKNSVNWPSVFKACLASITAGSVIILIGCMCSFYNMPIIRLIITSVLFFVLYALILLITKEQYFEEIVYGFISNFSKREKY